MSGGNRRSNGPDEYKEKTWTKANSDASTKPSNKLTHASSVDGNETTSNKRISLALLKQQKRAELNKQQHQQQQLSEKNTIDRLQRREMAASPNGANKGSMVMFTKPKDINAIILESRRTGQLNLSDFDLEEGKRCLIFGRIVLTECQLCYMVLKTKVPNRVWRMDLDKANLKSSDLLSMDEDTDADFKWWDQIDLSKLIVATNRIRAIPKEVGLLSALVTLDVFKKNQVFYTYRYPFTKMIN